MKFWNQTAQSTFVFDTILNMIEIVHWNEFSISFESKFTYQSDSVVVLVLFHLILNTLIDKWWYSIKYSRSGIKNSDKREYIYFNRTQKHFKSGVFLKLKQRLHCFCNKQIIAHTFFDRFFFVKGVTLCNYTNSR